MIKKTLLIVSCLIIFPGFVLAENINAGFVSGIWYSKFPFFSGEDIKIYSAVQNYSGSSISGKVFLYDFNDLIGETNFLVGNKEVIDVGINWTATQGSHNFRLEIIGDDGELISNSLTGRDVFVDLDTDRDEIGNREDLDDDNDGLSDKTEILNGLDPLNVDSDGDGINDNFDLINEFEYEKELDKVVESSVERVSDLNENVKQKSVFTIKQLIEKAQENIQDKKQEVEKELEYEKDNFARKIYLATLSFVDFTLENNIALYLILLVACLLMIKMIESIINYLKR